MVRLALTFLPVAAVLLLMWRWQEAWGRALYAISRMLLQLLLIGYVLVYIFEAQSGWIILAVLTVMVVAASWVALNTIDAGRARYFPASLLAVALGGGFTLALVTQAVLTLEPWYRPSYMVPLAGMVFANSMTAVSLAVERLSTEIKAGKSYDEARGPALNAALIPITNALFAVGLVSLPGMMTGMLINQADPLVAARYQIMVMCMIYGSCGLSAALFLTLIKNKAYLFQHGNNPTDGRP